MSYSKDQELFWNMLNKEYLELVIDNDSCYITYDDNEKQEETCVSFDFKPYDLCFMFGKRLGINVTKV